MEIGNNKNYKTTEKLNKKSSIIQVALAQINEKVNV